jgi:hypothetical protein
VRREKGKSREELSPVETCLRLFLLYEALCRATYKISIRFRPGAFLFPDFFVTCAWLLSLSKLGREIYLASEINSVNAVLITHFPVPPVTSSHPATPASEHAI